eukprot:3418397-Prymnesium_polylepis.2
MTPRRRRQRAASARSHLCWCYASGFAPWRTPERRPPPVVPVVWRLEASLDLSLIHISEPTRRS